MEKVEEVGSRCWAQHPKGNLCKEVQLKHSGKKRLGHRASGRFVKQSPDVDKSQ